MSIYIHKIQNCNWKERFEYLHVFKENQGHSNVPQKYQFDFGLGVWVGKQRTSFLKFKMTKDRINLLEFLKFKWIFGQYFVFTNFWNKKFKELKQFKYVYSHCNVSCKCVENKKLGFWVKNQRQFFKKGFIESNRIFLLSKIGFEWTQRSSFIKMTWNQRFRELEIYIKKQGNSLVPQRSGSLGKWVQVQRNLYKKRLMKEERKNRLSQLNFIWKPVEFSVKCGL